MFIYFPSHVVFLPKLNQTASWWLRDAICSDKMATCDSSGEKNRPPAYQQAKIINVLAEKGTVSMRHTSVHFRVKLCSMRLLSMRSNEGSKSEPWGKINVFCCTEDFLSIFFTNITLLYQDKNGMLAFLSGLFN